MSASSHTTNGAFPPSSMEVRSTPRAHCSSSVRPTGVDPVNDSLRAIPESIHGSTTLPGSVVHTTLRTPSGSPASRRRSTTYSEVRGVRLAGLNTMVQPAATAGPILRVAMARGKFHGVMRMQGPTGSWVTMRRVLPSGERRASPRMRQASSENQRKNSAP